MKKAKIFSIILAAIMVFAMLPQCVLAAEVETAALDTALGNLADRGGIYIKGNSLKKSVEIEGETYDVTYISTNEEAVAANGTVTHGSLPVYVTVTPQITVGEATVSGTAQSLYVLPSTELAEEKLFEDFEGEVFDTVAAAADNSLAAGTHGDWTATPSNSKISIEKDSTQYLYFSAHTSSGSAPSVSIPLPEGTSAEGTAVLTMRVRVYNTNTGQAAPFKPFGTLRYKEGNGTKYRFDTGSSGDSSSNASSELVSMPPENWYNIMLVRKNTSENVLTEVFVNGANYGDFVNTYSGSDAGDTFFISAPRANSKNYLCVDDIMVTKLVAPEIKLADKGNIYVEGDALPNPVTIGGVQYPVTYECSANGVISESGIVTHGTDFQYVTVTPTITLSEGVLVECKPQSLLVLPASYNEVLFEDFEAFEAKQYTTETLPNSWTYNNANSANTTAKVVEESDGNKYFHLEITSATNPANTNPSLSRSFEGSSNGKTLIGMRVYAAPSSSSVNTGFRVTPITFFNYGNLSSGQSTKISVSGYTGAWHDFLFIVDNSDVETDADDKNYRKITAYMDGTNIGDLRSASWSDSIGVTIYRNLTQYGSIDDIMVCHLDNSDYIISDVIQTNTDVTGFTVTKNNSQAPAANAYAAFYNNDGKLTNAGFYPLDFTSGNEAEISGEALTLGEAVAMKLFVLSDNLVPSALVYERAVRKDKPTIFILGDSTVCDYTNAADTTDKRGWGMYLGEEFEADSVLINNAARSGYRADTFMQEGYFNSVASRMSGGDILLIQFGNNEHNYSVSLDTYEEYLVKYINAARKKGVYPVLVTPTLRNERDEDDNLVDPENNLSLKLEDYVTRITEVAKAYNVPLINLRGAMRSVYEDDSEAYKEYFADRTHFSEEGAKMVAGLIADGIKAATPALYIADKIK